MSKQKEIIKILVTCFACIATTVFLTDHLNAGLLEPPGPPAPTMKTLDEVEARIPVQSLPGSPSAMHVISQSGSFYLTANINGEMNKHGIEVTVNNVTIDLNGFSIIGPSSSIGDGINASRPKITVMNGSISYCQNGIILGIEGKVINVTSTDNSANGITVGSHSIVRHCIVKGNLALGIVTDQYSQVLNCVTQNNDNGGISGTSRCLISDCVSPNNGSTSGSHGIKVSSDSSVFNCISSDNGGDGIYANDNCTVIDCTASGNDVDGIDANSSIIKNCTANDNGRRGISAGGTCLIVNCLCDDNGTGVYAHSNGNTIQSNHLTGNSSYGLDALDRNYAAQNTFYGNGTNWTGAFTPGTGDMQNIVIP